ncbi:MAG: hypothetical protein E7430_05195 [Ruminococcaceae bacterium]|nr:hypothetical protein [Oscillospiraceae bacterium]
MKTRRFVSITVMAAAISVSLSGCFLLPEEPEIPALPLVTSHIEEDYKTEIVQKGDLELTADVTFSSVPLQEEELAFAVSGERYGGIYVQVGDRVKAGDLVAEMNNSAVNSGISAIDDQLSQLDIELDIAVSSLEVARQLKALTGRDISEYEKKVTELEDEIHILNLRRLELEQEKESRRLYASIDGTVTYTKTVNSGSSTIKNSAVVTIANREEYILSAFTEHFEAFAKGEKYTVTIGDVPYEAKAVEAAELGFEPESRDNKGTVEQKVYLVITDNDAVFENDSFRGEVHLVLDSRQDVMWLPSKAVVTIGGQPMVYYQDETGLRSAKAVETGLEADSGIEIISGLEAGDEVIVG